MELEKHYVKARSVFQKTYKDSATVKIYEEVTKNGVTKTQTKILYENIPCKLCYHRKYLPIEQKIAGENEKSDIFLMISPEIDIPLNSEIVVNRRGKILEYINSNNMDLVTHRLVILRTKDVKV